MLQNGDTALHIAAAMGRRKLTKILLESGCDKEARNKQNETAMDISRRKNLGDVISSSCSVGVFLLLISTQLELEA